MFLKDKKVILCLHFFFFVPSTPQTFRPELCTRPSLGGGREEAQSLCIPC